jgi:hypothetical protein
MEAVMALDEIDLACELPRASKKTRVRIDWKRGATLLVAGETPDAVAAALGITADRLWGHLRRSARFQFLLRQARETQLLLGRLQLEAASNAAAIRCARQAEKPPAGLFEQFKSTSLPAWEKPALSDGRDMVLRLADSLRRAPKRPPRAAKSASDISKAEISPDKGEISENKTRISEPKSGISPEKSATGADKPAADADNALKIRPAEAQPASPTRRAYDHVALGLQNGGIVDLTDMRGNPLPGVEAHPPSRRSRPGDILGGNPVGPSSGSPPSRG